MRVLGSHLSLFAACRGFIHRCFEPAGGTPRPDATIRRTSQTGRLQQAAAGPSSTTMRMGRKRSSCSFNLQDFAACHDMRAARTGSRDDERRLGNSDHVAASGPQLPHTKHSPFITAHSPFAIHGLPTIRHSLFTIHLPCALGAERLPRRNLTRAQRKRTPPVRPLLHLPPSARSAVGLGLTWGVAMFRT